MYDTFLVYQEMNSDDHVFVIQNGNYYRKGIIEDKALQNS
jgi:hypothetical protein